MIMQLRSCFIERGSRDKDGEGERVKSVEGGVLKGLTCGNSDVQIQAAMDLSTKLSKAQRQKLAERGVIDPLLSMLYSRNPRAIEASLFALLSLAFRSERNKMRIVRSGAVPLLLNLFKCKDGGLIDLAVAALLVLSSCAANKPEIAASGAVHLLVGALTLESVTLRAKLDAISALHNLSTCDGVVPLLLSRGAVRSLILLISGADRSSDLVEKAVSLLERVVSQSPESALGKEEECRGAVRELVAAVEEGTSACKESAAEILLAMCRSSVGRWGREVLREGAVPGVMRLGVEGTSRGRAVAGELLVVLRDLDSDEEDRERRGRRRRREAKSREMVEGVMEVIGASGELKVAGSVLRIVEEMIAKLGTRHES